MCSVINGTIICRICWRQSDNLKSLLDESETNCEYSVMFESLTSSKLEICDGAPSRICGECESSLVASYDFQRQCLQSIENVKVYLENMQEGETDSKEKVRLEIDFSETEVMDSNPGPCKVEILDTDDDPAHCANDLDESGSVASWSSLPENFKRRHEVTYSTDRNNSYAVLEDRCRSRDGLKKSDGNQERDVALDFADDSLFVGRRQQNSVRKTFKIVQTFEKGRRKLRIVPSRWEIGGKLFWPKTKADKLIRIADSKPGGGWIRTSCKLKRNNLISYEAAAEELDRMSERDETEPGESELSNAIGGGGRKRRKVSVRREDDDFNTIASTCMDAENNPPVIDRPETGDHIIESIMRCNNSSPVLDVQEIIATEEIQTKLDKLLENQYSILKKIDTISIVEGKLDAVLRHSAKMEAMFDTFAGNSRFDDRGSFKTNDPPTIQEPIIRPISSFEELENFNKTLNDKKAMADAVTQLSYICGSTGMGNGFNNCYILVDRILTRKFLTLCSWAGGARDKKEKIPFKVYKNVIEVFFKVINRSDSRFTLKNCEDFFKNVIRNSTRRSESSLMRSSTVKRRPSKLKYKMKEKYQEEIREGDENQEEIREAEDEPEREIKTPVEDSINHKTREDSEAITIERGDVTND